MQDIHDGETQDFATLEPTFAKNARIARNLTPRRRFTAAELAEIKRIADYYREKPYLAEALRRS